MERFFYELEFRLPSSPRMRHSKRGGGYMDADYRQAQYDFRRLMVDTYGRLTTILPTKRVSAAPKKGREEQTPYRNVQINYCATLAGHTPVDTDNTEKFLLDSLGPLTARQPTKKDIDLQWSPLYANDRQTFGGHHLVVDNWPYNHLELEVVRLDSPEELAQLIEGWRGACRALTP